MCNVRVSQKALKRKIHSVFSHTLSEDGRRRTGRSGGKAAEEEESWWDLESTGMFNGIQLSPQLLYYHTWSFFLPHSIFPAATYQGDIYTPEMGSEPAPPTMLADRSCTTETGLCKGELDHRLAILGSTHQPGTFLNFFTLNSRALQRGRGTALSLASKPSFQSTICPLTSSVLQRHSDKLILPVTSHTATNSDPSKSKADVTLGQPPAPRGGQS